MKKIDIIVPCYNEQDTIYKFYNQINSILKELRKINYRILFINDGSIDDTLKLIKKLNKKDKHIEYISFSRNFGKEAAIYAGLEHSNGDYIAVMDVDLQDPPELLNPMFQMLIKENYDCVAARRVTRKGEPIIRSFFARLFYKMINHLSDVKMVDGARDFRLMTRQYVESVLTLREYERYSKGIFSFVGFQTKWIEYENRKRAAGETKWSFWKLLKYAISGIISFSTKPLLISSIVGVILCIVSFIAMIFIIIKTLLFGDPVSGWPSIICVILFSSGIQLFCLGIVGQYLAKIYKEVKQRPIYIIKEKSK